MPGREKLALFRARVACCFTSSAHLPISRDRHLIMARVYGPAPSRRRRTRGHTAAATVMRPPCLVAETKSVRPVAAAGLARRNSSSSGCSSVGSRCADVSVYGPTQRESPAAAQHCAWHPEMSSSSSSSSCSSCTRAAVLIMSVGSAAAMTNETTPGASARGPSRQRPRSGNNAAAIIIY